MIFRASELGRCLKASVAECLGYEKLSVPERVQGWFDAGNAHEIECIAAMRADGWTVSEGQEEVSFTVDENQVVGHLDGFCERDGKTSVLEVKSPGAWQKFERAVKTNDWTDLLAHRYAWQISVYMLTTDLEAVIACVQDDVVRTFGIEVPPYSREQIVDRIRLIENLASLGVLPAECSSADYPCGFSYLHEDPPDDVDPVLDELALSRANLLREKKALELGIKDVEDAMKARCAGRERVRTELVTVTTYEQAGPAKWDVDAMVADGLDVERYRIAGKLSTRTKITMRGER